MGFGPSGEPIRKGILVRARNSRSKASFLVVSQRHPLEALQLIAERNQSSSKRCFIGSQ
jgi:hypothetical protein